jgi:ABC-type multidrug transport system fused ATPase/permease subunit
MTLRDCYFGNLVTFITQVLVILYTIRPNIDSGEIEGRMSFVIFHRLSTIRGANTGIVIDHGEIVKQGSHQQLLKKRSFCHQLYLSPFKGQAI